MHVFGSLPCRVDNCHVVCHLHYQADFVSMLGKIVASPSLVDENVFKVRGFSFTQPRKRERRTSTYEERPLEIVPDAPALNIYCNERRGISCFCTGFGFHLRLAQLGSLGELSQIRADTPRMRCGKCRCPQPKPTVKSNGRLGTA